VFRLSARDKAVLILTLLLLLGYVAFRLSGGGFAAVEGRSMEPILHTGDLVVIIKKKDINVGDIVVYRSSSKFIIHRVIDKYEVNGYYCYITKGDGNAIPDFGDPQACPPRRGFAGQPESSIVGVVLTIRGYPVKIPYIGSITLLIRG